MTNRSFKGPICTFYSPFRLRRMREGNPRPENKPVISPKPKLRIKERITQLQQESSAQSSQIDNSQELSINTQKRKYNDLSQSIDKKEQPLQRLSQSKQPTASKKSGPVFKMEELNVSNAATKKQVTSLKESQSSQNPSVQPITLAKKKPPLPPNKPILPSRKPHLTKKIPSPLTTNSPLIPLTPLETLETRSEQLEKSMRNEDTNQQIASTALANSQQTNNINTGQNTRSNFHELVIAMLPSLKGLIFSHLKKEKSFFKA